MKKSLATIAAAATLGVAIAQESPVVTPLDPPADTNPTDTTPPDPSIPDPSGLTTPGFDNPPPPTFDLQATDNARLEQTLTHARQLATMEG